MQISDPRDGGRCRYFHHDPDGNAYSFRGVMVKAGMEKGVTEGMQRLEQLLEKLKKQGEGGASRAT